MQSQSEYFDDFENVFPLMDEQIGEMICEYLDIIRTYNEYVSYHESFETQNTQGFLETEAAIRKEIYHSYNTLYNKVLDSDVLGRMIKCIEKEGVWLGWQHHGPLQR